ncbi:MAG: hypothetical protein GY943_25405, partial [Chloroflexi bacterium]|nr:hypothetical protein [Chloroflexota bacterium]
IPPTIIATPTITPTPTQTVTPAPTPCAESGRIETAVLPSTTAGTLNYRVFLPPCYNETYVYPTLYMLPGNIHTDAIWDDLGLDETAVTLIQNREIPPLIIVMTDGGWIANNTSGGPGSYETVILNELIPHIEQTYCAWPNGNGRAIGGLSRGGYWALEIAFRHAAQFKSVGGHSAALLDTYAGPDLNPQYTGLLYDLSNLRIYLDIGQDDYVITNIKQLHEDMEATNVNHIWQLNEGIHEDSYWANHTEDYLRWYSAPWEMTRTNYPPCP